jgi:maleate cis-trans isomerase
MSDTSISPIRIGLIVPSGGPEADYYRFEESNLGVYKLYITISRVGGDSGNDHDVNALKETGQIEWILEAAERLISFSPDVYYWACTSASFVGGRAYAIQQIEEIARATQKPASSTSMGFAMAAQSCGLSKVSILATYPEPIARLFQGFLGDFGIETVSMDWLGAPSGWDASKIQAAVISKFAREVMHPDAEALLIPDTALPSLHFIEALESELGRPVITANAVTLWDALRLCDRQPSLTGLGQLLSGSLQ